MDALRLLGSLMGNNATNSGVGGQLMGALMGGDRGSSGGGAGGGAGGLGNALGGSGGAAGGLAGLLGGGGGSGGLLGGLAAAALQQFAGGQGGGAAQALQGLLGGQQEANPTAGLNQQQVDDQATILIRAMCNAAKADGQIDAAEQENIVGRLGEVGEQEVAFLRQELAQPLDLASFVQSVPSSLASQVYATSVMAIKLDTQAEAQYLGQLAQGLGINQEQCNQIHTQLGAPAIFG